MKTSTVPRALSLTLALTIVLLPALAAPPSAPAQTFTDLYNFTGTSGASPTGGVIFDKAGNMYGATTDGGASGCGTVFRVAQRVRRSCGSSLRLMPRHAHDFLCSGVFQQQRGIVAGEAEPEAVSSRDLEFIHACNLLDFSAGDGHTLDDWANRVTLRINTKRLLRPQ